MIAIIGGGISGLSAAWFAQKRGLEYVVLEASGRWGGKLQTEKVGDFVVEGGADSFLATKPWAAALARELGLGERLLGTNDTLRTIYILHNGQPVALPDGMQLIVPTKLWPFLKSPLLSLPGKLRMGLDWLIPPRTDSTDETIGSFVRRRFGQEALERLGEPFYRPDASRARDQGGVGLGLALCKEITTSLGGSLTIASTLGEGTTVTVTLPERGH